MAPDGIDLALVSVGVISKEPKAVPWQRKQALMAGDEVFTIGNPQHLDWSLTRGAISQFRLMNCGGRKVRLIQTDAALNPGNSGGGLYDKEGVADRHQHLASDKRFAEGINFAIAFETLLNLHPPLLQAGGRSGSPIANETIAMSTVRLRRLQADYEKLRDFLRQQPRIRLIQAEGNPPERYQLEYQIDGLRQIDEQLQDDQQPHGGDFAAARAIRGCRRSAAC